ncbi:hypothetical protein KSD_66920 [Ktedonobacter sp. SOSP1-85]|uniref:PAS domain S-box protein n=1 Tax=Ktedonobacter sp. SOSP1-85 TaxID=2778367 RepID=UPI0019164624|nr:PAS domain S-box protein [Ktedonobacter sp. SOSP1-85]GHO78921.1 hypothetical protein KSD_66920 [Ktedonobacter sp. SOSP1-85]
MDDLQDQMSTPQQDNGAESRLMHEQDWGLTPLNIPSTGQNTLSEHTFAGHTHVVCFSEHDASLITMLSAFLGDGLRAGDNCIVVATPSHHEHLEQHLQATGFDLAQAVATGTYIPLDAATTMARFLVDGQPDSTRFIEVIGPLIEQATQGDRRVRIFGEMVALLWAQGKQAAAIRLEELWNALGQKYTFSLFCAYPLQDFDGRKHEAAFTHICQLHSQLIPPTSYTQLTEQERLQTFTLLQQKANTLQVKITESQAAQERLRALAAIVESSDDAILSKTLSGIITSWNSAAQRIYGYTAQEMIGAHVTRLFPPDQYEEFEQIMAKIRLGEPVDHFETRRIRKDGQELLVSVTISPIKDENGVIHGASTIARDITEQRRLEAKSQRLFASNLIGIFVADETGRLLETNQAFLDLVGYTQDEWQAEAPLAMTSPAFLASFLCPLIQSARAGNGSSDPQETILLHKSGKALPILMALTCIEHTQTCIGFVLDISERKVLEQRKDIFIGMASHELKTPVTSLKGFLGLVQRLLSQKEFSQQSNEKILQYLARMDAQIEKLTKLINDLLDVSMMQTGQLTYREEQVEVDTLVREIVENVQETTQTHRLLLQGETRAAVFGDPDRLGQVLINLLQNAIKYSPNANTVLIHLGVTEEQVQIRVQDFGLGISKEHHQKIFERFYRVTDQEEKTYPGMGIGLTISQEIIKRHGGHFWVESERNKGAIFSLSLPLMQRESQVLSQEEERERMKQPNAE